MNKLSKLVGATAAATLVAISGTAFTASNTVAGVNAGSGSTLVTAYTTDVKYNLDSVDPEHIDSIQLTLNQKATYVALQTTTNGVWYTSTDGAITTTTPPSSTCTTADAGKKIWTCTPAAGWSVASVTDVSVVATDNITVA